LLTYDTFELCCSQLIHWR